VPSIVSSVEIELLSAAEDMTADGLVAGSEEVALRGGDRAGDALPPMNGSRPKKDHRFGVFVGLRRGGSERAGLGSDARTGMEFRRRGEEAPSLAGSSARIRSSTAPAVVGLISELPREKWRLIGDEVTFRSAVVELVREIIEETLPEREWLGRAVAVLLVSLETKESGRGINSSVSENPTRARAGGRSCSVGRL
jgi:hypothetical protein